MPPASESTPVAFPGFGGQVDLAGDGQRAPFGKSPACQNVQFPGLGRVMSRPGLTSKATFTGKLVSLKEWVSLDTLTRRILAVTDQGEFLKESPVSSFAFVSVATDIVEATVAATLRMNSVTAFGREYMAFATNGNIPCAYPRQFDDTNLDPIAPCGPGAAPGLSAPLPGAVQQGSHGVRVCFLTRSGYLTPPGPAASITVNGVTLIRVAGIVTGPSYVVGRILCFTPECSNDYFYLQGTSMVINDNSTTTVDCDFADGTLIAGVKISVLDDPTTDRAGLIELPPQAAFGRYNTRLIGVGERASFMRLRDSGLINLSFGGGFVGNCPAGWGELVAGESDGSAVTGIVGGAVKITGDGVGQRGCLENSQNPVFIPPGVNIRIRIRAKKSASATGSLFFYFSRFGTAAATIATGFQLQASALSSTECRLIDGVVLAAGSNTLATNASFRMSGGAGADKLPNAEWITVDSIELYQENAGVSLSRARVSNPNAPEEYDALNGFCLVNQNDGQRLNGPGFQLGRYYYFTKDRALYAVYDDGGSSPGDWTVSRISNTIGTYSAKGVALGDNYALIASRSGLWYFNGSGVTKVSKDWTSTWKRINWKYGHTVSVEIDVENRRALVAVPLDGATVPSTLLVLEWDDVPAQADFNRWFTADSAAMQTMAWSERDDGTRVLCLGTDHTSGKLLTIDDAVHNDYGVAIDCRYRCSYVGGDSGRRLFDYFTAHVVGSGSLQITPYGPDGASSTQGGAQQAPLPMLRVLTPTATQDEEWALDSRTERLAMEFQTNAVDAWFGIQKAAIYLNKAPYGETRGRGKG